ncbi:MAG: tetratricopeptide repeat protein, partial [Candidatus Saccharicenans sp.]
MRNKFFIIIIFSFLMLYAASLPFFAQIGLSEEERACQLLAKGEPDKAIDILNREIKRLPQNLDLNLYLGIAYYLKNDSEKAFREFEKIEKEIDRIMASQRPIGDEAMFLEQAMDRKGNFFFSENKKGLLYFLRGLTLKEKKEFKNAEKKFLTARKYDYEKFPLALELTDLYLLNDNLKSASKEIAELKKNAAQHPMTIFMEASFLYKDNKVDESLATFDQIKDVLPEAKKNIAIIYYNNGDYLKALGTFEEILAQAPGDMDSLINAGRASFQLGDKVKAQEYFDKAGVKVPPESYSPKKLSLLRASIPAGEKLKLDCR